MVEDSPLTPNGLFPASTAPGCRKRASCKSSRYFDAQPGFPARAPGGKSSRYFEETPAGRLEGGGVMAREARSEYFASSADSCAGSAESFDWGSAFTPEAFVALKACERFEGFGVRHLCRDKCYYYAYEPFRKWHALRLKVAEAGSSMKVLDGWAVQADRAQRAEQPSWRIKYVSPDGKQYASAKPALEALGLGQHAKNCGMLAPTAVRRRKTAHTSLRQQEPAVCRARHYPDGPAYLLKKPLAGAFPPSPFGLIEEILTDDPWRLLIGCIMLNQTTRSQMDRVLWDFLQKFPTASIAAAASVEEVTQVVAPLGLQERRPVAIIRFSQEYLSKPWKNPEELFWVGKYASDAYKVFVERRWRDVHPDDHALNWWVEWMRGTQSIEGEQSMAEPCPLRSRQKL